MLDNTLLYASDSACGSAYRHGVLFYHQMIAGHFGGDAGARSVMCDFLDRCTCHATSKFPLGSQYLAHTIAILEAQKLSLVKMCMRSSACRCTYPAKNTTSQDVIRNTHA